MAPSQFVKKRVLFCDRVVPRMSRKRSRCSNRFLYAGLLPPALRNQPPSRLGQKACSVGCHSNRLGCFQLQGSEAGDQAWRRYDCPTPLILAAMYYEPGRSSARRDGPGLRPPSTTSPLQFSRGPAIPSPNSRPGRAPVAGPGLRELANGFFRNPGLEGLSAPRWRSTPPPGCR